VLLEVDGKPLAGLPLERVTALVRGPAGTKVKLRVAPGGETKARDIEITRAKVEVPVVAWAMLPGPPIAHVAIREFGVNADSELREAIQAARKRGVQALIIDVRGNPGGLKEQAVAVTSEFLKDGNVFLEKDEQGHETAIPVQPGGIATDIPLAVLIEEGSASSAEIFAGAIQDHERGKLVGAQTFGTGTVLRPFGLSDGSAILVAVQEWYTPKGRQIWHKGITPDVPVKLPEGAEVLMPEKEAQMSLAELRRSDDTQLLMARDILLAQLKHGDKEAAKEAK
jgi:carboxyl-terminal processing protease